MCVMSNSLDFNRNIFATARGNLIMYCKALPEISGTKKSCRYSPYISIYSMIQCH